jgi:TonB family protein
MPEPPGGMRQFYEDLIANIQYPKSAREASIGGKVVLKFIVNQQGILEDVTVINGSGHKEIDDEAIRVVTLLRPWTPGKQNGRAVRVFLSLPITFALDEPHYVWITSDTSRIYQRISSMVFNGFRQEALGIIDAMQPTEKTPNLLCTSAVLKYHSKRTREACRDFKSASAIANGDSYCKKLSDRWITQYCD